MKLGKISLIISAAAFAVMTASATVYNTGYSVSTNGVGKLVDNLWKITDVQQVPIGASIGSVPYAAFVLPNSVITWPWDVSAAPAGAMNNLTSTWDSTQSPAFGGSDTTGMLTTYTLNFTAAVGKYNIYFEADNYLDMYLGSVSLANRFYTEASTIPGDFQAWQSTTVNITVGGSQQLNIVVSDFPYPTGNYTGLRVNFGTIDPVPEPSSVALMASGFAALTALIKRLKK